MSTKAELLDGLRIRLNDLAKKRWPDDELNVYLVDAARDYSKYFPRKVEMQFTTDGLTNRYDVPEDLIDDQIHKITILDVNLDTQETIPHRQIKNRGSSHFYEVVDQEIVFGWIPEADLNILVRYNATHVMPDSGSSSIPFEDEDLIYTYCMATAWQRIGGNDAGLSRWTEDQKRDDSPLIPHYVGIWQKYSRLIEQKMSTPRFYKRVRSRGTWRSNYEV